MKFMLFIGVVFYGSTLQASLENSLNPDGDDISAPEVISGRYGPVKELSGGVIKFELSTPINPEEWRRAMSVLWNTHSPQHQNDKGEER